MFGVEGIRGEQKYRNTMIFRIISKSTGLALSVNIRVVFLLFKDGLCNYRASHDSE